ncbi:T9SS type A sorting domain-containing protein [Dyadobacter sp. LHD-138]|uniref:T9SS type A sorting domain-containing protein n=1 Tax=Dyadobacter sp. LHD-138 TaxID=3071413 RepID=UPI0027E1CFFE|nr:T9SS type A sorting domain-containing protein [Dyadobacter sp. LHD-138]MDQ6481774.1 T9SS type A sorting domain-containing protein [Dyadobacter sp. LHD-138]
MDNRQCIPFSVYDLLGRKVNAKLLQRAEGKMDLDVSRLPVGMYLISVRKGSKEQIQNFVVH